MQINKEKVTEAIIMMLACIPVPVQVKHIEMNRYNFKLGTKNKETHLLVDPYKDMDAVSIFAKKFTGKFERLGVYDFECKQFCKDPDFFESLLFAQLNQ